MCSWGYIVATSSGSTSNSSSLAVSTSAVISFTEVLENFKVIHEGWNQLLSSCQYFCLFPFPGGSVGKEPTCPMQETRETWVQSWVMKIPWRRACKPFQSHSSILASRIPWREQPDGLQSTGSQRVEQNWSDSAHMHESQTLQMASRLVNSVQKSFNLFFPVLSEELQSMAAIALWNALFKYWELKIKVTFWLMGCKMDFVLAGMKSTLSPLYISIRALGWPGTLPKSTHIVKGIFSWAVSLNNRFKIFSKPCGKQIVCLPGFHFSSAQSLSHVQLFVTPWIAAARPPCPSPTPRVYSNSCPLSWWCHPAISSSVVPFFSHAQSFPASETFPMSQLFVSGDQNTRVSASVLPASIQGWFRLRLTGLTSLLSKGLSGVFSSTTVRRH